MSLAGAQNKTTCTDEFNAASDCGNGFKGSDEECDDGDTENGDGCSASCTIETGFSCVGNWEGGNYYTAESSCYTLFGGTLICLFWGLPISLSVCLGMLPINQNPKLQKYDNIHFYMKFCISIQMLIDM